jgi:hypothetical protein
VRIQVRGYKWVLKRQNDTNEGFKLIDTFPLQGFPLGGRDTIQLREIAVVGGW